MDLAIDTNALVYAHFSTFSEHVAYRCFIEDHLAVDENRIVLSPLIASEWLHVVTDSRRFDRPLSMAAATTTVRDYFSRSNVLITSIEAQALADAMALIEKHRLGRKRIVDTLLAASLRNANVSHLLTRNTTDFSVFEFLTLHDPAN